MYAHHGPELTEAFRAANVVSVVLQLWVLLRVYRRSENRVVV